MPRKTDEQKAAEAAKEAVEKETIETVEKETTQTEEVAKASEENVLILRAKKPMTTAAFKAAAEMVRSECEATGLKIVLIPFSTEVVEK